ncbi:anti-sigma factor [Paraburkholderia sp. Ac-20340]|uniref:anti-sigma factor family protein n=1 Tax=Paraburkholderia sp. Ac-20340 TaxID=2703888 RepID=UPI001F1199E8|nr:anti-sigma factor [Paraburkholderia sp. Ac-20340]MBN3855138.1 anti-sigma factor [Paraburkholderia sp. Ac-20340]
MNDDELERKPGALSAVPDAQADLAALGAFVDGELPPDARAAMAARLLDDETAARRVGDYRAQKAALQALSAAGEEAAPLAWRVLRRRDPWWRRTGIAAAWAVVGAGFTVAAGSLVPQVAPQLASAWSPHRASVESHDNTMLASDTENFARRADVAYAVYSPEVRHPVEVGAADEAHLVAWLSKRLGRPLTIPPLGEYGYTLVGGRLLPGGSGPAAQFMYQNGAGERLTLYVSASGRERDAVQLLRDGGRRTFYWSTDRMGYALSGPASEGRLRKIAYDVCGDLGGNAAQW